MLEVQATWTYPLAHVNTVEGGTAAVIVVASWRVVADGRADGPATEAAIVDVEGLLELDDPKMFLIRAALHAPFD